MDKQSLERKLRGINIDPLCWIPWGFGGGACMQAFYEFYKNKGVLERVHMGAAVMSGTLLALGIIHYNAMKYKQPEKENNLLYLIGSLGGVAVGSLMTSQEHFAFMGGGVAIGSILSLYNHYKQQKRVAQT